MERPGYAVWRQEDGDYIYHLLSDRPQGVLTRRAYMRTMGDNDQEALSTGQIYVLFAACDVFSSFAVFSIVPSSDAPSP